MAIDFCALCNDPCTGANAIIGNNNFQETWRTLVAQALCGLVTQGVESLAQGAESLVGADNIATGQITVATAAGGTVIAAARATRKSITIVNHGTTDVFIGDPGLTTGNGVLLTGTKGAALTLNTTAAISGIVSSGTQVVSFVEEYA